jgi:hypothetical protein
MVDGISCGAYMMRSGSLGDKDTKVLSYIGDTKARDLMFSRLQLSGEMLFELSQMDVQLTMRMKTMTIFWTKRYLKTSETSL